MTSTPVSPDDTLVFVDEVHSTRRAPPVSENAWRVLIVDDDQGVHSATTFALSGMEMLQRKLEFLHAFSAAEARRLLLQERDIAVILLDVVMEQEDAGLQLARYIREELGLSEARIILRTGQSGYAPEIDSIRNYDINDYKTKSELTRTKLFTAVATAIRSYQQIHTINDNRRGLEQIVQASAELTAQRSLENFAACVIAQSAGILRIKPDGILCDRARRADGCAEPLIVAGAGRYRGRAGKPVAALDDRRAADTLVRALDTRRNFYGPDCVALYLDGDDHHEFAAFLDTDRALNETDRHLLEIFCRNISAELKNVMLVARLKTIAFSDALTKLPNRARLLEMIDEALDLADRNDDTLALVDIDHFAEINDAIGHQFGDALLLAVANRLHTDFGTYAKVARAGGDTFGLLGSSAQVDPATIRAKFEQPFNIDGQDVLLSATVGLVRLQNYQASGTCAMRDADIALKKAKMHQRAGHVYFSHSMGTAIRERVQMIADLRSAFEARNLFVAYQPQVDLATHRPLGAEALVRWKTSEGALISPDKFIPVAEYSGIIITLGEWVMREAFAELMRLHRLGFGDFTMSVNVSLMQFRHPHFLETLGKALNDTQSPPEFIELEITESVAMEDPHALIRLLEEIKRLGIKIAIDDFGTGFSSLSYLQQLHVDRLKIDRAFVTRITGSSRGSRIADMVVQLGHSLGLDVIAEGIEDEQQAAVLAALGCSAGQGYLFGRPMPGELLCDWLKGKAASHAGRAIQ